MPELRTNRLRLVPLEYSHVEVMHEMSVDPEVRRYLFEGQIIPVSQVEEMVASSQQCFAERNTGFFALHIDDASDVDHGAFVGFCGHRVFENGEDMELLVGMRTRFWGRGFGEEAARAVLRFGFEDCGIQRVLAATDTPNQRSVQVLQRLGMSFTHRRQWHGLDTVFYDMSAEEFAAQSD